MASVKKVPPMLGEREVTKKKLSGAEGRHPDSGGFGHIRLSSLRVTSGSLAETSECVKSCRGSKRRIPATSTSIAPRSTHDLTAYVESKLDGMEAGSSRWHAV